MRNIPADTIGGRIRATRQAADVSIGGLAAAVGCSIGYVSTLECNKRTPSVDMLRKIAEALEVPIGQLADGLAGQVPPRRTPTDADTAMSDLVELILRENGPQLQSVILIEEMAELIQVLCKLQRGKFDRDRLSEEFTHVKISCEVIRRVMGIADGDVSREVRAKLAEYAGKGAAT